ncbi:hypothetical protein B7R54_00445 [Subtercola boreus]|uniref:Uncharacterized protein n=1 Tax=Subtercola boreus TaxID=120213 RepID=A0A3E0VDW7_9MICO|nr:hypothetical protein [Subtercola boreus]RFA07849.1 hypothetical protein B7R54_00445 [Subtercola boreus]TQL55300.1 hypothetical protein FB464_2863 [Subtercola boreus]
MLPADSVESNWIELLYDLSTWESGLTKNGQQVSYTALRRMGAVAIVSVAAHGSVYEFHQSLAPGVEPVGVPFEIADFVFTATGETVGGRTDRSGSGSGSTRCLLAPATASEGGRHDESCRLGIVGYAVVMSMFLAACLAFLQVAAVFTPENQSYFVEFGFFFGLVCAPLGAISGAVSGLSAHLAVRRVGNDRSVGVRPLTAAVVLALGSAPGVWLAIWMYGIFDLDIHTPSPQYLVELAAAVCVLACGGALHLRSRLDRANEGAIPGGLE